MNQKALLLRLADHVIWTNTRKDLLVSINIITGMMSTTLVTAAAVVNQMDVIRPAFDRLVNQFPSIVQQAAFKADELAKFFDAICPIYLLYRGSTSGAALCGRLVLEEVARYPSVTMNGAEFRQGPNEVIDERFGAVMFIPGDLQGQLMQSLSPRYSRGRRQGSDGGALRFPRWPAGIAVPCQWNSRIFCYPSLAWYPSRSWLINWRKNRATDQEKCVTFPK